MPECRERYPKYLDWLRFLSAWLLFLYGSSKLLGQQFHLEPGVALKPIGSLTGYQLAWIYYSYSHTYAVILGLTQLAGATMLLFRKTTLLGAAVLLPVMANIVMINVFFHIAWGALCTSVFIFISVAAILWHERPAFLEIFWSSQVAEPEDVRRYYRAIAALVVLLAIALMSVGLWLQAVSKAPN
ncbi:MAG TPA: hypothetical protein VEG63_12890 [Candidatus Acidoferrales bacterium]|nr:hypothetical protein [Candidatus Acidoferrales bacterium]